MAELHESVRMGFTDVIEHLSRLNLTNHIPSDAVLTTDSPSTSKTNAPTPSNPNPIAPSKPNPTKKKLNK